MATTTSARGDSAPGFGERIGHFRWVICGLLFFATTINYIDRQVLGILAPDLQREVGWSELDYGRIVIAFQASYAVMMLVWGKILDRIGTKLGLGIGVLWWSVAAMGTAFARSAMGFGAVRFLLGVGEAANFPASIKTVAEWFPKSERAFATGIFNSGTNIGAVVAPICVPLIAAAWGWRMAFILTGALGFLWLIVWWALYETAALHPRLHPAERKFILDGLEEPLTARTGLGEVIGYRQLWAFALGKLLTDPIWWFYLFWLPKFLAAEHGIRGVALIPYLTTVYLIADAGSVFGGYLSSTLDQARLHGEPRPQDRDGDLRVHHPVGDHRRPDQERVDGGPADRPGYRVPPGVVGEHLHAGVRHVPAARRRHGRRLRRLHGRRRRHSHRRVRRPGAERQPALLLADVRHLRHRVSRRSRGDPHPGAAARAGADARRRVSGGTASSAAVGVLSPADLRQSVRDALRAIPARARVLAVIPDRTRDDNTDLLFPMLSQELFARGASQFDALVAQGTHPAMTDAEKRTKIGAGLADMPLLGTVFDHHWDQPSELITLGTLGRAEVSSLSGGLMEQDVPVQLNARLAPGMYDYIFVVGATVPHEVAGFAGGSKYFFPGVAGPELTHLTHWLGALATIEHVIGRVETPTRRVIEAAADRVTTPVIAFTSVATRRDSGLLTHALFTGSLRETVRQAAAVSSRVHVRYTGRRYRRVIALLDEHYDETLGRREGELQAGRHHRRRRGTGHLRAAPERHFHDPRPADREVRLRAARDRPRDGRRIRRAARQSLRRGPPGARQLRQPRRHRRQDRAALSHHARLGHQRRSRDAGQAGIPAARAASISRRRAAIPTRSSSSTPAATCT